MNTQTYGFKVLFFIDTFIASLIWRDAGITISAMCGLELKKPKPRWWARAISRLCNLVQANHCALAVEYDTWRAYQTIAILTGKEAP